VNNGYELDVLDQLEHAATMKRVSIQEFAEGQKFCGKILYPRQRVLLKLIFLEELTDFEETILDGWIKSPEITISPEIRERSKWLRDRGYPHFREIVMVGGRRSSKGWITGMTMAKKMYDTLQLQDPNRHFGIDADKEIYYTCVAASETQAKGTQYADFASMVNACYAMQDYIKKVQELEFSVLTEADRRLLKKWKESGRRVQRDIAKLRGKALSANARTIRGYTIMAIVFDEMAHLMQGESDQADEEIYEAALPSLAQFNEQAIVFCNSSPYTKVGKFFERFQHAMATENGTAAYPSMLGIQFPSWAMFEGWWEEPETSIERCITVSPDWDPDRRKDDGALFYGKEDRQAILIERDNESQNPEKFKVERRGRFAEVIDSYLIPDMVDRMFAGKPNSDGSFTPFETNWDMSTYLYRYKAHLDPSSTTAGFGFALGHIEEIEVRGRREQHVIFDIIKRWNPKEFPSGVIEWEGEVLPWVLHICDLFRPYEVTLDQFQSSAPIQWLRRELRRMGIGETRVYEKTATATFNWNRAEVFKTALYQGAVHAPSDTDDAQHCIQELKYLQEVRTGRIPRVDKQEVGPVQTKDMADCAMEVVNALIGNVIAKENRAALAEGAQFGSPGGYPLGGKTPLGPSRRTVSPVEELIGKRFGEQRSPASGFNRRSPRSLPERPNPARGMSRSPRRGRIPGG
jgi:hypothetical protein